MSITSFNIYYLKLLLLLPPFPGEVQDSAIMNLGDNVSKIFMGMVVCNIFTTTYSFFYIQENLQLEKRTIPNL